MSRQQYLLVSLSVLPSVYPKVVEAKSLLASGSARSVAEAVRACGISRSAFYKYKDCVFAFHGRSQSSILSMQITLDDRPGVLSSLLSEFTRSGANILTVNQSIPVGGAALVSVSASLDGAGKNAEELIDSLRLLDGVRAIGSVSSE